MRKYGAKPEPKLAANPVAHPHKLTQAQMILNLARTHYNLRSMFWHAHLAHNDGANENEATAMFFFSSSNAVRASFWDWGMLK